MNCFAALRVGVIAAVPLLAVGTGCIPMSRHNGSDLSKLDEFKIEKNKTTEKELVDRFGPAETSTTRGDGDKILEAVSKLP